jgi:hypothetical protein
MSVKYHRVKFQTLKINMKASSQMKKNIKGRLIVEGE